MEQIVSKTSLIERRTSPRIICDYPAVVKGMDALGNNFAENARVINLSSSGIFMITQHSIKEDTDVQVKIGLPTGSLKWGTSGLATNGNVIRNESQSDGMVGIAVKFLGYKFL